MTQNPTAAMLVIGDEILSGRTRDANMHHLAGQLAPLGIDLKEVRVVADDHDAIVAALRALSAGFTHVFTSGGIGPTHDDITADAVAAAFERPIDVREDAKTLLVNYYEARGDVATPARLRMARIPEGAALIDNPVSIAPGFTIGNVHVLAGVPAVFQAMLVSILPKLTGGRPLLSQSLRIERPESEIAGVLAELAAAHPGVAIGSYPFNDKGVYGANIVVRGHEGAEVDAAIVAISTEFSEAIQ
ncbi:MAG: competence/damage-inducible protein A [Rhodobacterales bacterium]|nr:MAG: competence/damage-inducible protein A [Rhodobacterales bacterium]